MNVEIWPDGAIFMIKLSKTQSLGAFFWRIYTSCLQLTVHTVSSGEPEREILDVWVKSVYSCIGEPRTGEILLALYVGIFSSRIMRSIAATVGWDVERSNPLEPGIAWVRVSSLGLPLSKRFFTGDVALSKELWNKGNLGWSKSGTVRYRYWFTRNHANLASSLPVAKGRGLLLADLHQEFGSPRRFEAESGTWVFARLCWFLDISLCEVFRTAFWGSGLTTYAVGSYAHQFSHLPMQPSSQRRVLAAYEDHAA